MNNAIELSPEKITELFNELKTVLNRASLSDEDELFTCWEDFKKAYCILDDLYYEDKLSYDEGNLLSELQDKLDSIIEDKQEEIQKLTDKNLEEGKELQGEELKNNTAEFYKLNKKSLKISELQLEISHYNIEVFDKKYKQDLEKGEELLIRLEEKRENSHKILANQADYSQEQIQKAKEFLLVFFGEEN